MHASGSEGATSPKRRDTTPGWNPGAVDFKQQVFLLVYVLLGTLSVLDLCAGIAYCLEVVERHAEKEGAALMTERLERMLSSGCDFFAAHCILMLATIVHRTPTLKPYDYLLWFMRLITFGFFVTAIVRFVMYIQLFPEIY